MRIALENARAVEAGLNESLDERLLGERAGDAATPEFGIILHGLGHQLVAHDVADDGATALAEHAENFLEKLMLGARLDEIEHAVRDHDIDGISGDERRHGAQFLSTRVGGEERVRVMNRIGLQVCVQFFQIERQVLDAALAELHVLKADGLADDGRVFARHGEHVVVHVHADDAARRPNDLRGDETNFSRAAAEVEHRLARLEIFRGITAAVIAVNDFLRDDLEILAVVFDGAAKRLDLFPGRFTVAAAHRGFDL